MFWKRATYPNDADGQALRRIAKDKAMDLSRPMLVDIFIMSHNQANAEAVATEAQHIGYKCDVDKDDDGDTWTTTCSKPMMLTYDSIIAAQKQLDDLAAPHNARTDGWGTFGNVEQGEEMNGAIGAKTVTYDFERLMEGATLRKCSEFGDDIVKHMTQFA